PDRLRRAPRKRRGEAVGRPHQVLLGEAVDVSEPGHLAVDDPDAGATLSARLRPLDPGLVDREREAAALLAEELGEVTAARQRSFESLDCDFPSDQWHGFAISRVALSRALSSISCSWLGGAGRRPRSGARPPGRAPCPPPSRLGTPSSVRPGS